MSRLAALSAALLLPAAVAAAQEIGPADEEVRVLVTERPVAAASVAGGTLAIALDLSRVTDTDYRAVVESLCQAVVDESAALESVTRMLITERTGETGFVFRGGAAFCEQLLADDPRARALQITTRTNPCRDCTVLERERQNYRTDPGARGSTLRDEITGQTDRYRRD